MEWIIMGICYGDEKRKRKRKHVVPVRALQPPSIINCVILTTRRRSFCLFLAFCSIVRGGISFPCDWRKGCIVSMLIFHMISGHLCFWKVDLTLSIVDGRRGDVLRMRKH